MDFILRFVDVTLDAIKKLLSQLIDTYNAPGVQSFLNETNIQIQSFLQGAFAPLYSLPSLKTMLKKSDDLKHNVLDALDLNAHYVWTATVVACVYYRFLTPAFKLMSDAHYNTDSYLEMYIWLHIWAADMGYFLYFQGKMFSIFRNNFKSNTAFTANIANTATQDMPISPELKSCACGPFRKKRAGLESGIIYFVNRTVFAKVSDMLFNKLPQPLGLITSFSVESASFGWPLIEYKLSALGLCTEHRAKKILANATYCFFFGVAFVSNLWAAEKLFKSVAGTETMYMYDGIFTMLFQLYVLIAIAKSGPLPAEEKEPYLVPKLKQILLSPRMQAYIGKFLGTPEEAAQLPGVSFWLSNHRTDIKEGLQILQNNMENLKDNPLLRVVKYVPWLSKEVKKAAKLVRTLAKQVGPEQYGPSIQRINHLFDLAEDKEAERHAIKYVPEVKPAVPVPEEQPEILKKPIDEGPKKVLTSSPHVMISDHFRLPSEPKVAQPKKKEGNSWVIVEEVSSPGRKRRR